ncbi:hypothetical protein ACYATP_06590 [Lactobacillaceae bacterium Melli_B4]
MINKRKKVINMKNNEFDNLKQGFQEALDFINQKPVPETEVDTFTVKRTRSEQLKHSNNKDESC